MLTRKGKLTNQSVSVGCRNVAIRGSESMSVANQCSKRRAPSVTARRVPPSPHTLSPASAPMLHYMIMLLNMFGVRKLIWERVRGEKFGGR